MRSRSFFRAAVAGAAVMLMLVLILWAVLRSNGDDAPLQPAEPQAPAKLDVPYVPTQDVVVDAMLKMAAVNNRDYVIDLGSGDGRILIQAAREHGARGLGVDIDPARIRDSRYNVQAAGVADKAEFRRQDLFETPLGDATVLTLYLAPDVNLRLRPRILAEMRPGARVVSHSFHMGDWRWDERQLIEGTNVYLWIVPARVEGRWRLQGGGAAGELTLRQTFQDLTGSVSVGGRSVPIEQGLVRGDRVRFVADLGSGRRLFDGRMVNGQIVPITGERPSYPVQPATGWRIDRAA